MTRRKKLKLLQDELTAINIVIEQNNIIIKPIIRIFLNRLQGIIDNNYQIGTFTETEQTAFNIE